MSLGVARRGPVLELTLDRPERQNALDAVLIRALRDQLAAAERDPDLRLVRLGASGKVWCSGADLLSIAGDPAARAAAVLDYAELLADLAELSVPVLAVVDGAVRGGGVGLLCGADLVAMSAAGTVALPEAQLGVWPMMVGALLPRVVSPRLAMELALTGRLLNAQECLAAGLATRLGSPVDSVAAALTQAVLRAAPGAVRAGRAAWAEHAGGPALRPRLRALAAALDTLGGQPEAAAGVASFLAKRAPPWAPGEG